MELGEELLPAQDRQRAQSQDEDQRDDGTGEEAPPDSPGAALAQVEDGNERPGPAAGRPRRTWTGSPVLTSAMWLTSPSLNSLSPLRCTRSPEVARTGPVAQVVHGVGAVGHPVVRAEPVPVAGEAGPVVFHPQEQRAGDGADREDQEDHREEDGQQDLHHPRRDRLGVGGTLALGVAPFHFLLRWADLQAPRWAAVRWNTGAVARAGGLQRRMVLQQRARSGRPGCRGLHGRLVLGGWFVGGSAARRPDLLSGCWSRGQPRLP